MSSRSTARGIGSCGTAWSSSRATRILHVGPRFDGRVDETVDAPDRIVTPGLISTHAHISGSPLDRSFIEDRGNPQFWYSGLFEMLPVRSEAQDEEAGRACVDFSMAELLRGGVTTVMEIGTLGEYVVERAAALRPARLHGPGLPVGALAHARRQARGVGVERGAGAGGPRARHRVPQAPRRRPRRPRALLRVAVADRHLHARAAAATPSASPTRSSARTRCTPRSPSSSSTRWSPATARRPSPG